MSMILNSRLIKLYHLGIYDPSSNVYLTLSNRTDTKWYTMDTYRVRNDPSTLS